MIDKEWLERVSIAYKAYTQQAGPSLPVENFIIWLYKQYGIVNPHTLTNINKSAIINNGHKKN